MTAIATRPASERYATTDTDETTTHRPEPCRDNWGRYLVLGVEGKPGKCQTHHGHACGVSHTRATTFVDAIDEKSNLIAWKSRMVAKGLTLRPDLYAKAASTKLPDTATMTEDEQRELKRAMDKICEQAGEAAGSSTGANLGTALHTFTEQHDMGEKPTIPAPWDADIRAYAAALADIGLEVVPEFIERVVVLQVGGEGVAGTFDRVYRVTRPLTITLPTGRTEKLAPGELVVGDVKTGRIDYSQLKIASQLSLYARAEMSYDYATKELAQAPNTHLGVGIVVHLPAGAGVCTLHGVDLLAGWQAAELCADIRASRKTREFFGPIDVDVEVDLEDPWHKAFTEAATPAEVNTIARAALDKGELTDTLKAYAKWVRGALVSA